MIPEIENKKQQQLKHDSRRTVNKPILEHQKLDITTSKHINRLIRKMHFIKKITSSKLKENELKIQPKIIKTRVLSDDEIVHTVNITESINTLQNRIDTLSNEINVLDEAHKQKVINKEFSIIPKKALEKPQQQAIHSPSKTKPNIIANEQLEQDIKFNNTNFNLNIKISEIQDTLKQLLQTLPEKQIKNELSNVWLGNLPTKLVERIISPLPQYQLKQIESILCPELQKKYIQPTIKNPSLIVKMKNLLTNNNSEKLTALNDVNTNIILLERKLEQELNTVQLDDSYKNVVASLVQELPFETINNMVDKLSHAQKQELVKELVLTLPHNTINTYIEKIINQLPDEQVLPLLKEPRTVQPEQMNSIEKKQYIINALSNNNIKQIPNHMLDSLITNLLPEVFDKQLQNTIHSHIEDAINIYFNKLPEKLHYDEAITPRVHKVPLALDTSIPNIIQKISELEKERYNLEKELLKNDEVFISEKSRKTKGYLKLTKTGISLIKTGVNNSVKIIPKLKFAKVIIKNAVSRPLVAVSNLVTSLIKLTEITRLKQSLSNISIIKSNYQNILNEYTPPPQNIFQRAVLSFKSNLYGMKYNIANQELKIRELNDRIHKNEVELASLEDKLKQLPQDLKLIRKKELLLRTLINQKDELQTRKEYLGILNDELTNKKMLNAKVNTLVVSGLCFGLTATAATLGVATTFGAVIPAAGVTISYLALSATILGALHSASIKLPQLFHNQKFKHQREKEYKHLKQDLGFNDDILSLKTLNNNDLNEIKKLLGIDGKLKPLVGKLKLFANNILDFKKLIYPSVPIREKAKILFFINPVNQLLAGPQNPVIPLIKNIGKQTFSQTQVKLLQDFVFHNDIPATKNLQKSINLYNDFLDPTKYVETYINNLIKKNSITIGDLNKKTANEFSNVLAKKNIVVKDENVSLNKFLNEHNMDFNTVLSQNNLTLDDFHDVSNITIGNLLNTNKITVTDLLLAKGISPSYYLLASNFQTTDFFRNTNNIMLSDFLKEKNMTLANFLKVNNIDVNTFIKRNIINTSELLKDNSKTIVNSIDSQNITVGDLVNNKADLFKIHGLDVNDIKDLSLNVFLAWSNLSLNDFLTMYKIDTLHFLDKANISLDSLHIAENITLNSFVNANNIKPSDFIATNEITSYDMLKLSDIKLYNFLKTNQLSLDDLPYAKNITLNNLLKKNTTSLDDFLNANNLSVANLIETQNITLETLLNENNISADMIHMTYDDFIKLNDVPIADILLAKDIIFNEATFNADKFDDISYRLDNFKGSTSTKTSLATHTMHKISQSTSIPDTFKEKYLYEYGSAYRFQYSIYSMEKRAQQAVDTILDITLNLPAKITIEQNKDYSESELHDIYQNNLAYKNATQLINSLLVGNNTLNAQQVLLDILSLKRKTGQDYEFAYNKLRKQLIHEASTLN